MKKFILNVFIGIIVFIVTWVIAETLMAHISIVNEYSYKYKYVIKNPTIKTLLIGHSHFHYGVNPKLMGEGVFNFAIAGRWIYYDAELLPRIIPYMPNLETVIFPLGYPMPYASWHYRGLRDIDKDYAYYYARYMDIYYDYFPQNIYLSSALIANKMEPKYWKDAHIDSLGFSPQYGQGDAWEAENNVSPTIFEGDTAINCYKEFCQYFKQLAKVCHDNNIRFIAVTCPCADVFIKNTCEQGVKNLYDLVDSVASYNPVEYYNYLDDEEFRADSIYYNCSHLNSIGADIFTLRLKKDLGL